MHCYFVLLTFHVTKTDSIPTLLWYYLVLGIFGFISEGATEGAVPALKGVIPHYDGDVMAPFANTIFPDIPALSN